MSTNAPISTRITRVEIVEEDQQNLLTLLFQEALREWAEGRLGKMQVALQTLTEELNAVEGDPVFEAPELAELVDQLALESVLRQDSILLASVLALPHNGGRDNFYGVTVVSAEAGWRDGYRLLREQNRSVELLCRYFTDDALYQAYMIDDPTAYVAPEGIDAGFEDVRRFVASARNSDGTLDAAIEFLKRVGATQEAIEYAVWFETLK